MAEITLRSRLGAPVGVTLVDDADEAFVNQWTWRLTTTTGYAFRGQRIAGVYVNFRLHRVLLGLTRGDGLEGDHIDGDPLNNQRSNLRVATRPLNGQNLHRTNCGSSQHRGVSWHKTKKKWGAKAKLDQRQHHLGYFTLEEDAAAAARAFRLEHMPFSTS